MRGPTVAGLIRRGAAAAASALLLGAALKPGAAQADEGGISYWIPGFFGILAAAPVQT